MNAEKIALQIHQVEVLLEQVDKGNYFEEISKDFYKKYGKIKTISAKSDFGKNYTSHTMKFAKETPQNSKRIHAQHLRLMIKASKMQQDDLKKAFALMHKNIWNWWD